MKVMLDIDVGNTCVKWRIVQDKEVLGLYHHSSADEQLHEMLLVMIQSIPSKINGCRLSCVKSLEYQERLVHQLQSHLATSVVLPQPLSGVGGLQIDGVEPHRLGCDRWLAMLSAKHKHPNQELIVVDCGTAVTIDRVSRNGDFLGGLILPGLGPMKAAMKAAADKLLLPDDYHYSRSLAKKSTHAAQNGIMTMILCVLEKEYTACCRQPCMIITGGDAPQIIQLLEVDAYYEPNLVMEGLALALPSATK